jgi:hypothetical protein
MKNSEVLTALITLELAIVASFVVKNAVVVAYGHFTIPGYFYSGFNEHCPDEVYSLIIWVIVFHFSRLLGRWLVNTLNLWDK